MRSYIKGLLALCFLIVTLCSCNSAEKVDTIDKNIDENKIITVQDSSTLETGDKHDLSNYVKIPENDAYDNPSPETVAEWNLYWKCEIDCFETVVNLASEINSKKWEEVEMFSGFLSNLDSIGVDLDNLKIDISEEEKKLQARTVVGKIGGMNGNSIYILAVVAFPKDNTQGEIYKVYYRSGKGDAWTPTQENEIVDAYNLDLWKAMYQ